MSSILNWTDPAPPCDWCSYHHTTATTPFGRFLLTWKGWDDKPWDSLGFDETPWEEIVYNGWNSLEDAQLWADSELSRRCKEFLQPPSQSPPLVSDVRNVKEPYFTDQLNTPSIQSLTL